MNRRTLRWLVTAGAVTACLTTSAAAFAHSTAAGPTTRGSASAGKQASGDYDYYLALGDSLAWGAQPNASGVDVRSGHGYADDLAAYLRGHGYRVIAKTFVPLIKP